LVGARGRVVAFEPVPRNLAYLHQHVRVNAADNVTILELAVADKPGRARFHTGASSAQGALSRDGDLEVAITSLDALVAAQVVPAPTLIKMDIEGGELLALRGAAQLFGQSRPTLLLATHGQDVHRACVELLRGYGYNVEALDGGDLDRVDEVIARPC
jgi:FkbM family methyltransferase